MLSVLAFNVVAQAYPNKPIRLMVPYAPGQSADIKSRFFGAELSKSLGQPIIVDNRPGAGGNIGTAAAAKMPADGYTIMYGTAATFGMNPSLYRSVGFDPDNDFTLFSLWGRVPLIIAAGPSFTGKSFEDLVAMSKAKPKSVNTALPNTTSIVVNGLLGQFGVELYGVPYTSSARALTEVYGGQLPLTIDALASLRPAFESGRLKPLAITSLKTSILLPGVKSIAEQGLPGFEVVGWSAFFAAKATPAPILGRLHDEMAAILARADVQKSLLADGSEPSGATSLAGLAEFLRNERVNWAKWIKASNIPLIE